MKTRKPYCYCSPRSEEPARQIAENAGNEGSVVVQRIKEGKDDFGYNAQDDKYEPLHKAGLSIRQKLQVALEMPLPLRDVPYHRMCGSGKT